MLHRLFISIVTTLFFITAYGQSHSMDIASVLSISDFSSKKEAITYWKCHCHDQQIDREVVREKLSKFIFDYDFLKKKGFYVLNSNDNISNVFSNISLNCMNIEEKTLVQFLGALVKSSVTKMSFQRLIMTPEVGEAFVTLLKGVKRFQKLNLNGIWNPKLPSNGIRWEGFDSSTDAKYQLIKRIGLAANDTVEDFVFYKFSSIDQDSFDFVTYDPVQDHRDALEVQKLREEEEKLMEATRNKILWACGLTVIGSTIVYPKLFLVYGWAALVVFGFGR